MARRHEIQNLQRPGNVFYWRSRIPSRMASRGGEERLSLSLRLSDHIKAGYKARRLNTLLHELRLRPNVMTTTKDQLAALFRAEIERMLAHLDDVAMMERRFGNADDPGQLDADLEVGWAYRLLQLFGSRKPLAFEDTCPGRALLLRNGIPVSNIDNIAATFLSEQQGMRSGVFEEQVKARMAEFSIPDTVLNRERALTEILHAKADVLLDVSERYPMVDRERSAFTRTAEPSARENTKPTTSALAQKVDASITESERPRPASSSNADVEAHDAMSEAVTISGPVPDEEAGLNNLAPEDNEGEAALDAAEPSAAEVYEISAGARDVGSAIADDIDRKIISARGRVLPVAPARRPASSCWPLPQTLRLGIISWDVSGAATRPSAPPWCFSKTGRSTEADRVDEAWALS